MKKYQENIINESIAEETLMDNLLNFFIAKYGTTSVDEVEKHVVSALSALVDRGELNKQSVEDFLEERGIELALEKPKEKVVYRERDVYSNGGCGYSSGRSSSC